MRVTSVLGAVLLATATFLSACVDQPGQKAAERALDYLVGAQNPDGGFSATAGAASDFSTSAWVALAFGEASAPIAARDSLVRFLASQAGSVANNTTGSFSSINAASLLALAGIALGAQQTVWNHTDPIARLRLEAANSSLGLNERLFVLGTLGRAADAGSAAGIAQYVRSGLADPAHDPLSKDAWFRGTAVLALIASGDDPNSEWMRGAARSLLDFQKGDGGFFSNAAYEPDASTTALVLAVVSKVSFVYSEKRTQASEYLETQQQPDGSVVFSKVLDFSRTKTTAEAILGWSGSGPFGKA